MTSARASLDGETILRTSRLGVRRWREDDLAAIHALYADPEGSRWVGDGTPITWEESVQWLDVTARNYQTRGYGMFAVEDLTTRSLVGCCGLVHPGGQVEAEIKYAYERAVWGRGYASEIAVALVDYGARVLGLEEIIATVAPENTASQRVLANAGFEFREVIEDEDGSTHVFEWFATDSAPR